MAYNDEKKSYRNNGKDNRHFRRNEENTNTRSTEERSERKTYRTEVKKIRPTFVKKKVQLGSSKYYDDSVSELYNLLDQITFDLVAVPVSMLKSVAFANPDATGNITIGNIVKFDNNEFTISVQEQFADKITDESVVIVNCTKDRNTGEFTYVNNIFIVKGTPIASLDDELLEAFTSKEDEE